MAKIERIVADEVHRDREIEARYVQLKGRAFEALQLLLQVPQEMVHAVHGVEAPG